MGQPEEHICARAPDERPNIIAFSPRRENPPIGADIFLSAYTAGWDLRQKSSFFGLRHPSALRRLDSADANNQKSWRRDYSSFNKAADVDQGDGAPCTMPITPPSTPDGTQLCDDEGAEDGEMDELDAVLSSLFRASTKDVEKEVEGALCSSPSTCDGRCRPETPPPGLQADFDLDINILPPLATTEASERGAKETSTPLLRGAIRKLPDMNATFCRLEGTTSKRARHSDDVKPVSILRGKSSTERSKGIVKHSRPVTRSVAASSTTTTETRKPELPVSPKIENVTSVASVPALPRVSSVMGWGKLSPLAPTVSQTFGGESSLCAQLSLGELGEPGATDLTEAQLATIVSIQ